MGIFSFLFGGGKYPTTAKYEAQLEQQKADYAKFQQLAQSPELKRYNELKSKTESSDFQKKVDHLKNDKYSDTQEYQKEMELKDLQKSSDIKKYLKFVAAGKDKEAERALSSANYKEYTQIQNTEDPEQLKRLKELKKDSDVKTALKALKSSDYANFKEVHGSDRLKKKEALEAYVQTKAFLDVKNDLTNKNRYKESEEAKLVDEFAALKKDKSLLWYFDMNEKKAFADMNKWTLSFEEQFSGAKLDQKKWLLGYYLGKKNVDMVYSLADERQAFDVKNAVVAENKLALQTRAGEAQGMVWNPQAYGFTKQKFESSSALINTGDSFRQKYGKFEFKVRATGAKAPVTQNIWLSADNGSEVTVATFGKEAKTLTVGAVAKNNKALSDISDLKYANDFFIYSLEWSQKKLTWSVNGVEVFSTTSNVPQDPMYIGLSSNVIGEGDINDASLDVEWIKVYTEK